MLPPFSNPTRLRPKLSSELLLRVTVLLLGKHVATRHAPAWWLELRDVFCSTEMVTDMAVPAYFVVQM